jgi:4-oxalocrotonate tautomerase family enzyme
MPHITVNMWSGRTREQKAKIAEAITNAMVEIAGNTREKVNVVFNDVDQDNWAIGGKLSDNRPKHTTPKTDNGGGAAHQPTILHAALRFRDLERAEGFYCDLLGFGVRSRDEFRDGEQAIITKAGVGLVAGRSSDNALDHIAFEVASLADAIELVEREGIKLIRGPLDMPYGRSIYVEDPEGTEVELIEVTEQPKA